jgi:6-phosphogluconolactonase/glucosamine-6-phosphate isomerase/deaminase
MNYKIDTPSQQYSTVELYKPIVITHESTDFLNESLISYLTERINDISGEYGTVRLGLSTSQSLLETYKVIGQKYTNQTQFFPFDDLEIYQLDEEINNNKQSKMKELLSGSIDNAKFVSWIPNSKPTEMIEYLSEEFNQFDDEDFLDICLVEIDNQGQVMGLVANGNGLKNDGTIAVSNLSKTINTYGLTVRKEIVSISMQTLLDAKEIICVLRDDTEIMEEIFSGSKSALECPAKMLLAHPKVTIFYNLDI